MSSNKINVSKDDAVFLSWTEVLKRYVTVYINKLNVLCIVVKLSYHVWSCRVAFGTGHMQTCAVLSRGVRERFDKHVDGHLRGKMLVHLLPHESGG